jgi:limonene-1,2-epoxide hydrolase
MRQAESGRMAEVTAVWRAKQGSAACERATTVVREAVAERAEVVCERLRVHAMPSAWVHVRTTPPCVEQGKVRE